MTAGGGVQQQSGIGAHGAAPDKGRDPVYIAAQIVTALQSIDSRELNPLEPGVITVGSFHAGSKHNIISEEAKLQLTVRSNDEATRAKLEELRRAVTAFHDQWVGGRAGGAAPEEGDVEAEHSREEIVRERPTPRKKA